MYTVFFITKSVIYTGTKKSFSTNGVGQIGCLHVDECI